MEANRDNYIKIGKSLEGRAEYAIAANGLHGPTYELDRNTVVAGDDTVLAVPECGVFGVFDGAGGAQDFGSAWAASRAAARATHEYFDSTRSYSPASIDTQLEHEQEIIEGLLPFVRRAVENEPETGLTTATVLKLIKYGDRVIGFSYANAGDSTLLLYPDPDAEHRDEELTVIAGEQINPKTLAGDPSNIIGRLPEDIVPLIIDADQSGIKLVDQTEPVYLSLATDGVSGNWMRCTELTEFDYRLAVEIEPKIRAALGRSSMKGGLVQLAKENDFELDRFSRDIWHDIVKPKISNGPHLEYGPPTLEQIADSLMNPRVVEDLSTKRKADDMSLVLIKLSGL